MKANEAPEMIYIPTILAANTVRYKEKGSIEYVRTDAFIEKACEYISEHIEYYMKKDKTCNVPLCPLFATKSFIENFRKYMEGE